MHKFLKNITNLEISGIILVNPEILHIIYIYILKQSLLKEITIVSYGSHNDYHFIITALAEGFRGQFTKYKNTNKYQKRKQNDKKNINLSVPMKQEN